MAVASDFANAVQHHQAGRLEEAALLYRSIPPEAPQAADALHMLGLIARAQGNTAAAIDLIRQAAERLPAFPRVHYNLAHALVAGGHFHEAVGRFRRTVELDPGMAGGWHGLGRALAVLGETGEAIQCFRRCVEIDPNHVPARQALVAAGVTDQVVHLERILREHPLTEVGRIGALFALGAALDQAGRFDDAFAAVDEANRLSRAALSRTGQDFDAGALRDYVDRRIAACSPGFFRRFQGCGNPSEQPVFVVGMPRSGTTLVERILASHPAVSGVGESHRVAGLVTDLGRNGNPDQYGDWDPDRLAGIAQAYLGQLQALAPDASRVVDKTPDNLFHAAAIAALFPRGRIIFCRRDPRDTCLSAYFQNFEWAMPYSNDLGDCAIRAAESQRLMGHWLTVLPLPMAVVQYETLIAEPGAEIQRLVAFLGLAWDPACLRAHRSAGAVTSSSVFQVRRPLYAGSVGRWTKYESHLGPLMDVLGREWR